MGSQKHSDYLLRKSICGNSVMLSWTESLQINRRAAREAVLVCMVAYREGGFKTNAALDRIGPFFLVTRRRLRSLFFNEPTLRVDGYERNLIVTGMVAALRWYVSYQRERADYWESMADIYEREANEEEQRLKLGNSCRKKHDCRLKRAA